MQNLTTYLQTICEVKLLCTTTIAEKLRQFQSGTDHVDFKEIAMATDKDFYVSCQQIKNSLVKWRKGLRKEKSSGASES